MKSEELLRALGEADEKFIEEAAEGNAAAAFTPVSPKKRRYNRLVSIAACAAVLVIGAASVFRTGFGKGMAPKAAEAPAMAAPRSEEVMNDAAVPAESNEEMKPVYEEAAAEPETPAPDLKEERSEASPESEAPKPEAAEENKAEAGKTKDKYAVMKEGGVNDIITMTAGTYDENYAVYLSDGEAAALAAFTEKTMAAFIGEKDGKNKLYSPVNTYLAVNTLSSLTAGNTRDQILALTGLQSAEDAEELSGKLMDSIYRDDGYTKSFAASSLWLDRSLSVKNDVLKRLAEREKLSSYVRTLSDPEALEEYKKWISEQTAGLLDSVASTDQFRDSVAVLAETLYFKASWAEQFKEGQLSDGIFKSASGDEDAVFMNRTDFFTYRIGDGYRACGVPLADGSTMWFALPGEGTSAEALIESGALADIASENDGERVRVMLRIPKFDVSSEISLKDGLMALGITDAFCGLADFSPLTDDPICIDEILHAVRVKTDENGVEAAALTQVFAKMTAYIPEGDPVAFICDRPFAFAVTGRDGTPLFAGIVNHVK